MESAVEVIYEIRLTYTQDLNLCLRTDDSHWMDWMAWSDCSARCGQGVQTRRRHCYISQWGLNKCLGSWGELKTCTHQDKLFCMGEFLSFGFRILK